MIIFNKLRNRLMKCSTESIDNQGIIDKTFKNLKVLITDNTYMLTLLVFVMLGYGLSFYFRGIHVDDLDAYRFFDENQAIAQGRLTPALLNLILNNYDYNIFHLFFSSVSLLTFGAILNAAFIKTLLKIDNNFILSLVSSLLVIFPIMYYIQIFLLATFTIAFCTILTFLSNLFILEFIKTKKIKFFIFTAITLTLIMSAYEVYMFIYLIVVLFTLLFKDLNNSILKLSKQETKKYIVYVALSFILAVLIENILVLIIQTLTGTTPNEYLNNRIMWADGNPSHRLRLLIVNLFIRFFLVATASHANLFFVFTFTVFLFIKNNIKNFLIKISIIVLLFILSFIFGVVQIHRMSLSLNYFMMYAVIYIYVHTASKTIMKKALISLTILGCFFSAQELNNAFEHRFLTYQYEANAFMKIGNDIRSTYGEDANIFIYGFISTPDNLARQPIEFRRESVQGRVILRLDRLFSLNHFNHKEGVLVQYYQSTTYSHLLNHSNAHKIRFMNHHGFNFQSCNVDLDLESIFKEQNLSSFPIDGYITEVDGCVIIRLN